MLLELNINVNEFQIRNFTKIIILFYQCNINFVQRTERNLWKESTFGMIYNLLFLVIKQQQVLTINYTY